MTFDHEKYREDAAQTVALYEQRYASAPNHFLPLVIARSWLVAMDRAELDMEEIARIARRADQDKNRYDVAFHAFANDLVRMERELRQALARQ